MWENGGPAWYRVKVTADECSRISPEFLTEEWRTLGEWWYRQEDFCEFLDSESQAFRREDIDEAFAEEVTAWQL